MVIPPQAKSLSESQTQEKLGSRPTSQVNQQAKSRNRKRRAGAHLHFRPFDTVPHQLLSQLNPLHPNQTTPYFAFFHTASQPNRYNSTQLMHGEGVLWGCSLNVKVSGDSKGLSFCPKKLILRLWAAQNCPPSNQIPVTHNTKGFQVWSCHTAPPGGQEVQNVSF